MAVGHRASVTTTASPRVDRRRGDDPVRGDGGHEGAASRRARRCTGPSPSRCPRRRRRPLGRPAPGRRQAPSGPGARSASASAISASSRSAIRACSASASACTQAIDEPGRMSWNCWSSTSFHSSSSSAATAAVRSVRRRRRPTTARPRAAGARSGGCRAWSGLARQRAPVRLEVQLAPPHRDGRARRGLGLDVVEEPVGRAELEAGHAVEVGHAAGPLDHLPRRPAAAVAVAERHQRPVAPAVLVEVAAREPRPARPADLGVVGVDRREVGEHPRPVEALPPERAVREAVLLVPRQLLGDEPGAAAGREDLRQRGGVAEHVGDPHLACSAGRSAPRSTAARARSGARWTRRSAGSCRPRPTCPPTGIHCPAATFSCDAGEQLGMAVARSTRTAPPASRRSGSRGSRPSAGPPRRTCGCTCGPSRASATATRCRCARGRRRPSVCALARARQGERRGEHLPCGRRGAADVVEVERVEGPLERPQQAGPAGVVQREGAHGPVEHLDVEQRGRRPCGRGRPGRPGGGGRAVRPARCRASRSARAGTTGTTGWPPPRARRSTGRRPWRPAAAPRSGGDGRPARDRRRSRPGPRPGSRRRRTGSRGRSPPRPRSRPAVRHVAVKRNQVVPHGRPHAPPSAKGS